MGSKQDQLFLLFIHPFIQRAQCCVPGSLPGAGDAKMNKPSCLKRY